MLKLKKALSKDRSSIASYERPPPPQPQKKRFSLLFFKSCSAIDSDFRHSSKVDSLESSSDSSSSMRHKRSKSYSTPSSQFEESGAASTLLVKDNTDERSDVLGHADTVSATTTTATEAADSDRFLQLGMQCHERGELDKATYYWRLSAENESPLGLFFYGIALRHGWVNDDKIIKLIRKQPPLTSSGLTHLVSSFPRDVKRMLP